MDAARSPYQRPQTHLNEPEARVVQSIFKRFARGIQPQLQSNSSPTKVLSIKTVNPSIGYLYRVLNNRVYLGEAVHKGTPYPGEHPPIVEPKLWDQVHGLISANPQARAKRSLGRTPALLKGLIFGKTGRAMTPAHTRKRGRHYRYYVSIDSIRTGTSRIQIDGFPAEQIESAVVAQIKVMLQSPEIIVAAWRVARKTIKGLTERQVAENLRRFDKLWSELFPAEQARIVQLLVERIEISEAGAISHSMSGGWRVWSMILAAEPTDRDTRHDENVREPTAHDYDPRTNEV